MIDPGTRLFVFEDNNAVFTDHTFSASDYLRDSFSMQLATGTDFLYLGYRKPFNSVYWNYITPNTNALALLSAEVFDGANWIAVEISDETLDMSRDGYIFWDVPDKDEDAENYEVTINGQSAFFIRFAVAANQSAMTVQAANLIFADDQMLKQEFFEIDNSDLLPSGQTTHIATHVSTRNRILHEFNKLGYEVSKNTASSRKKLDQWDLFDIFEIRQAAAYLTLSTVFFNLSDSIEDHWWIKYKEYEKKFGEAMRLARLSVDFDDDGREDDDEIIAQVKVMRWNR